MFCVSPTDTSARPCSSVLLRRVLCEMVLKAYLNLLLLPQLWILLACQGKKFFHLFILHEPMSILHLDIFFKEFRSCLIICSMIFLWIAHIWTFLWTAIQKKGNWTHFLAFFVYSFSKFPLLVRELLFPSSHVYQGTSRCSREVNS